MENEEYQPAISMDHVNRAIVRFWYNNCNTSMVCVSDLIGLGVLKEEVRDGNSMTVEQAITRGATDPNKTLGARMSKMEGDVHRVSSGIFIQVRKLEIITKNRAHYRLRQCTAQELESEGHPRAKMDSIKTAQSQQTSSENSDTSEQNGFDSNNMELKQAIKSALMELKEEDPYFFR